MWSHVWDRSVHYATDGRLEIPLAGLHEPRIALDGGSDGLDIQRRVAAEAPSWLAPKGSLLVETSECQVVRTAEIFARSGLIPRVVRSDEFEATVVIGTRAGPENVDRRPA